MITNINPSAIKDGTISASKTDETIATKSYVDTQIRGINDKVNDFTNAGYLYAGIATPGTNSGTLNQNVFYVTATAGIYTHFGNIIVNDGELAFLYYDTSWHKAAVEIPAPESSTFEAAYGVTTFAEIVEAYNAGKSVTCRYGQTIAQLITITDSSIFFSSINIKDERRFICFSTNIWNYNTHNTAHELSTLDNRNVQVTIAGKSAEVATPAYVSDAIASAITNVLNEEV